MSGFGQVYVVDDESFDRLLYKRVIDKSGLVESLQLFPGAEDALCALRAAACPPDLILLDINMPRMTGFDFLEIADEELAGASPPIGVAILTTSEDPADKRRATAYRSVRCFLNKPLTRADLAELAPPGA